ncbi:hypothetical protein PSYJA_43089, partial [Pseudomonas syringae pv. japonica str. M301072]
GSAFWGIVAGLLTLLILTPIVIAMMLALRFSPASTLAFVIAAGFIV